MNHNTLGQLTDQNPLQISERGTRGQQTVFRRIKKWCGIKVKYVKNNVIKKKRSMKTCYSAPHKHNQVFKKAGRPPLQM